MPNIRFFRSLPFKNHCSFFYSFCSRRKTACVSISPSGANSASCFLQLLVLQNITSLVSSSSSRATPAKIATATMSCQDSNTIPDIEDIHRHAVLCKSNTYIDPSTRFTVFTEYAHLKRGTCCGNKCRHCPYGWENVNLTMIVNEKKEKGCDDYDTDTNTDTYTDDENDEDSPKDCTSLLESSSSS